MIHWRGFGLLLDGGDGLARLDVSGLYRTRADAEAALVSRNIRRAQSKATRGTSYTRVVAITISDDAPTTHRGGKRK